ncbi:pentatricopeptide repeat-containing protein At5g66520-like [Macadamia integrifolia]|uniref:pentatricopeptide repeat-containing protein At5g66520-like n=1 Tax=Macadamia integrifolia TaxID=60698 RepID=UPI001C4E3835|nr:pentatricopeptide repeat-containing protein At5g66520-like [Macadamia integrifolia]
MQGKIELQRLKRLRLLQQLQRFNSRNSLLRFIDECKNMRELKQIHSQIITSPTLRRYDHYILLDRLIFFCAFSEFGSFNYATHVFYSIDSPNFFIYNTMIRAYTSKSDSKRYIETSSYQSLPLYKQMLINGFRPGNQTFTFLIKECTTHLDAKLGRSVYAHVIRMGFSNDPFIQNSMINLYASCGFLVCARCLFNEMTVRDIISWNSIITGYLRNGFLDLALDMFRRIEEKNVITWNSMITGLAQGGRPKEALELFHEMQILGNDVVKPDKISIASVVSACAALGALDQGEWVHSYLERSGLEFDMVIGTSLVDMYGKCGCVERAVEVFKNMPHKDVFAWTAIISVLAFHGLAEPAFNHFEEMRIQGTKPTPVTFVALLSACAHSGLVDKAYHYFNMMRQVYSIEPQVHHYACMVDTLGRTGHLEEAENLIRNMPLEPDVFVWGALLGACQMHGNVDLGEMVAHYLIKLDPLNHAYYMTLLDIYAKTNRFDDVKRIRTFLKAKGIKKPVPGCSIIEIDGVVQAFSVQGSLEVMMEEIQMVLDGVYSEMCVIGNLHDISQELVDTET